MCCHRLRASEGAASGQVFRLILKAGVAGVELHCGFYPKIPIGLELALENSF